MPDDVPNQRRERAALVRWQQEKTEAGEGHEILDHCGIVKCRREIA